MSSTRTGKKVMFTHSCGQQDDSRWHQAYLWLVAVPVVALAEVSAATSVASLDEDGAAVSATATSGMTKLLCTESSAAVTAARSGWLEGPGRLERAALALERLCSLST